MPHRWLLLLLFTGVLSAQPDPAARITELEAVIEAKPDDVAARGQLLAMYTIVGRRDAAGVRLPRRKQILWLIENRPEDQVLRFADATLVPSGQAMADEEGYRLAAEAWKKHLAGASPAAGVYANAIHFFQTTDTEHALELAGQALARYPADAVIGGETGELFGLTIVGAKGKDRFNMGPAVFDAALATSDAAEVARREMATTSNPNLLARAGAVLASYAPAIGRQSGRQKEGAELMDLALRSAERALKLDPADRRVCTNVRHVYQTAAGAERDNARKVELLDKAVAVPGDDINRFYVLDRLAQSLLAAGALDRAAETASATLAEAPKYPDNWNYGNAIHWGHIVLGRVAFRQGKLDDAEKRLLAAGAIKGSPQLNSFGPDFELAKELVNQGRTAPVLEYIELVRKFWKTDRGALDYWAGAIRDGGVPTFSRMEAAAAGRAGREAALSSMVGKPAPELKLNDLAGRAVSLADFRGKAVLLDFWATWCAPCRTEMPIFEKLHREFAGKDVAVVTIDADEPEVKPAQYMKDEKFTFPVLLAEGTDTVQRWGVVAFPTTVVVDAEGRVAAFAIGSRPEAELREMVGKARK